MIETIYLCEWAVLALFFLYLWDLLMETKLDRINKTTLRRSRLKTLQTIAKANHVPISENRLLLTRKELLNNLLIEKSKQQKRGIKQQLALPYIEGITVSTTCLFSKGLKELFGYEDYELILLPELRQRLKAVRDNRAATFIYKAVKSQVNKEVSRMFCILNETVYGGEDTLVDTDILELVASYEDNHTLVLEVINEYDLTVINQKRMSLKDICKEVEDIQDLMNEAKAHIQDTNQLLDSLDRQRAASNEASTQIEVQLAQIKEKTNNIFHQFLEDLSIYE